jgi:tetratricopeptide (TPR) repeat protein
MARGGERGDRHPSAAELDRFLLGEMSPREAAPVISHLLSGCSHCREAMAPLASVVFAAGPMAPEVAPSSGTEYDFPMFKAFAAARQFATNAAREKSIGDSGAAPQTVTRRPPALAVLAASDASRDLSEALLEQCRDLRSSDPEGMILSASLALSLIERAIAQNGDSAEMADREARAWAELGNAYRVADDMIAAEAALSNALARSNRGTGDPVLLARVMDLTASLYIDQRRFQDARRLLDCVQAIHQSQGDAQAAARTFISKGIASNYALNPEEALRFLSEGLRRIDPAQDPKLVLAGVHGLLWCLVDSGRAAEADRLLGDARALYEAHGERFEQLRRLWLEGRIAIQLEEDERAEESLQQVREGYREADIAFDVALVSLDLATLWLRQGRTNEIEEILDETIAIFRARNLQREALGALLMLRRAFETDQATAALLQSATVQLWRLERSPARRRVSG